LRHVRVAEIAHHERNAPLVTGALGGCRHDARDSEDAQQKPDGSLAKIGSAHRGSPHP
jgi:hypothetical protein